MANKYHFSQLDENTQDYLLSVRDSTGKGMTGIYVSNADYLPIWGLIIGAAMIIGGFFFTLPPYRDPFKVALLQMAIFLPGAWMMIAAARVWIASGGNSYPGKFLFVDAAYLYQCDGYMVTVTPLEKLRSVKGEDNFNEGNYTGTTFTLTLSGDTATAQINEEKGATRFALYLDALLDVRERMNTLPSLGVQGGIARRAAIDKSDIETAYRELNDRNEPIVEPPVVRADGSAPTGLLPIGIAFVAAFLGIFLLNGLNRMMRDNALFRMVNDVPPGERPLVLRAYLIDPRNTRHRDEAEQMLSTYYAPALTFLRGAATDADLRQSMDGLLTALSKAKQPLVSVRVREEPGAAINGFEFGTARAAERQTQIGKRLATTITKSIGPSLVEVVEITEPDIPAMIDVRYKFVADAARPDMFRVEWTVDIRESAEGRPTSKVVPGVNSWSASNTFGQFHQQETSTLMRAMLGTDWPEDGAPPG